MTTIILRNMTTIYISHNNKMLLLYRIGSRVVEPSWCGIGGHFEEGELNNPKACVLRELFEETGIEEKDLGKVRLRYITLRLKNNEIRQNYYYFAELINDGIDISECKEGVLEWVDRNQILEKDMPFTAKECLKHYLNNENETGMIYAGTATDNGVDFVELKDF